MTITSPGSCEFANVLRSANFLIKEEARLGNDTGWQIKLTTGAVVCVYDSGKVVLGGKGDLSKLRELADSHATNGRCISTDRAVFVVYGHDNVARTQLEALLRRWNLEPLILDQLPSGGQTIIEKLEKYKQKAQFAVVLATPDDVGKKAESSDQLKLRARQNVVLELGMMLALLGRAKVAVLIKDQQHMEKPSDIDGLIYIPFKDDVKDAAVLLAKEINAQGLHINLERL